MVRPVLHIKQIYVACQPYIYELYQQVLVKPCKCLMSVPACESEYERFLPFRCYSFMLLVQNKFTGCHGNIVSNSTSVIWILYYTVCHILLRYNKVHYHSPDNVVHKLKVVKFDNILLTKENYIFLILSDVFQIQIHIYACKY